MINGRSHKVFTMDSDYKLIYKIVLKQALIIQKQISKLRRLQMEIEIFEDIMQKRLIRVKH